MVWRRYTNFYFYSTNINEGRCIARSDRTSRKYKLLYDPDLYIKRYVWFTSYSSYPTFNYVFKDFSYFKEIFVKQSWIKNVFIYLHWPCTFCMILNGKDILFTETQITFGNR